MARRRRRRHEAGGVPAGTGAAGRTRTEVAQVAARLMAEEGVHGFAEAKARAAARLGVRGRHALPRNDEIEAELRSYQALFQGDEHRRWLCAKRRAALDAMELLAAFNPRLAGSVLRGTAPEDAEVTLHLFVDPPEAVATFLYDRGIPWELDAWVGRFGGGREIELPLYRISPGGQPVRLIVFPAEGLRESPRSPVDGKPMSRAGPAEVEELLAEEPQT
ncbi:MAG: hypothetical protein U5K43_03650 [Halofilum sp. (in: g-proteobacteria)]|nr:hypothetical protein [Halofilum sp. (in: g-proteobacteria)]